MPLLISTAEYKRLNGSESSATAWRRWGPYLAERAWGTVREDYSPYGNAWEYFPHDHARSRVYRWNEDGLAGISDHRSRLCLSLALWNGKDPILKERLFGLTNSEGNHGEDVKEYYYYLDSTPTHSYMKMLYKYPQAAFPYGWLVEENRRRDKFAGEFELIDTGIFDGDRYFDVFVEYAKASPADILIKITAHNRGPDEADLHLLPTLWFRNTWGWGRDDRRPSLSAMTDKAIQAEHWHLGKYHLYCGRAHFEHPETAGPAPASPSLLFTENESNTERLWGVPNKTPYVKDGINNYVVKGRQNAVNPEKVGTKAAAHYSVSLAPKMSVTIKLRLTQFSNSPIPDPFSGFDSIFAARQQEADEFYAAVQPSDATDELKSIQRQALAGMLWSKQYYHYVIEQWLNGDPAQPAPPAERKNGRNREWAHLYNERVMSMPDKWEYPWYAAWDLAFHCIPLAMVDPDFAKGQLDMLMREWYMHPNGQIPAYEWAFGDVNPPVMAWAAWRVYKMEKKHHGQADVKFLEHVFHKLMLNFTWWVNRKDSEGKNVFQGGFLGLDNIGVFDRSAPLPTGGHIEQSDGTSWMGMFSLNMMAIALELAQNDPVYEDIATKFFEHFLYIAAAMNNLGGDGIPLWNEEDEFFYDVLHLPGGNNYPLKVRSFVGLIPLFAVETLEPKVLDSLPGFKRRLEWMLTNRPDLAQLVSRWHQPGQGERRLLALVRGHRMKRLLKRALDAGEFLSDYGVRALSKYHEQTPYTLSVNGSTYTVNYDPAESRSGLFGGNSNWRGPIWFPVNFLLIESIQKLHHYYGDDFIVECPTGSGQYLDLGQVADFLSRRLIRLFVRDDEGRRPVFGGQHKFQTDPLWRDYVLFYEYFHGDNGAGIGASHQTGWTGLVAKLIQQQGGRYDE
jgi:hypothetical protein